MERTVYSLCFFKFHSLGITWTYWKLNELSLGHWIVFVAQSQPPASCSAQPHATCRAISALLAVVALSWEVGLRALPEIFLQKRPNLFFLFVWKTLLVHHLAKNDLAIGPCCSVLGVCEFAALSWEGSECRVKTMVAHLLYNFGQDIQLPCSALL